MNINKITAKCKRLEEEQEQVKAELLEIISYDLDTGRINLFMLALFIAAEEEQANALAELTRLCRKENKAS